MYRSTGTIVRITTLGESVEALVRMRCLQAPVEQVRQRLSTTFPTANAAVKALTDLGIVAEMTGQRKNRSFGYQAYIARLSR